MKIIAGIVLFEPKIDRLIANIEAISPQVNCVLIINNGSNESLSSLMGKIHGVNVHTINNSENIGVAAALNQLLEYAESNGFDWALSLDQDSVAPSNMIREYRKDFNSDNIGLVCPRIDDINNHQMQFIEIGVESTYKEDDVITSGSCINVKAAFHIGGFDERLFIDFVDTDFQKRLLLSGYKIVRDNAVVLKHEIGNIKKMRFFGHEIICTNHNALRRYYQVRNRLYFKKKYYGSIALIKEMIRLFLGTVKIVLFENNKWDKIIATKNGLNDYKRLLRGDTVSRIKTNGMKISFVLPALSGTGGINVVYEYANRLVKRGHDVTVYAPIKAYNMHRGKTSVDLLKQIYATFKVLKRVFFDRIPRKLAQENVTKIKVVWKISDRFLQDADVIVATAWCTAYDVIKLNRLKGEKAYFVQDYEVWDNFELGKKSYQLPIKKIVIAEWIKDKLVSECGCSGENIAVINNGIDTKKFFVDQIKHVNQDGIIKCLMLDHDLEKKGVRNGVEAFNLAKQTVPKLSLTMFGLKKSKYVPDDIDYYKNPKQEVLVNLYQSSDIFIFPPLEEGWGLTPIEAMACGCAVVGTNVGCMLDIGENNENVILCKNSNAKDLASGIIRLSQNAKLREKIARNGYKKVQELDWEKATQKFEDVLFCLVKWDECYL